MNKHCYLFALEVQPLKIEGVYDTLPLHCTLMHRFWSELPPEVLAEKVRPLLESTLPLLLTAHERMELGPNRVVVSDITFTPELEQLHMRLYELLNELGVEYTAPEWVGTGYKAHVSERPDARLEVGKQHLSTGAYLIEVEVPGYEHKRIIRTRFSFK